MTFKEHSAIRSLQKKISNESFAEANPSEVTETFWIYATRKKGNIQKTQTKVGSASVKGNPKPINATTLPAKKKVEKNN